MIRMLIKWIKSCFAGSNQSRGKVKVDIADKKARDRGFRGKLNG